MGNHKFRISDMMPNSWLYKLKGIRKKLRSSPSSPNFRQRSPEASSSRNPLPLPPRNASIKRRTRRKTLYKPSPRLKLSSSSSSSLKSKPSESVVSAVTTSSEHVSSSPDHGSSSCDIVIDMKYVSVEDSRVPVGFGKEAPLEARTRKKPTSGSRKSNAGALGIKLRVNSPKISRKKSSRVSASNEQKGPEKENKGIAESFAMVLTSVDPERDFRQSMVEMIVENNIREQKDLEDLLACYLSLNSSEYHHVIINAFEKTWLHLSNSSL
ncbi:PREDICTED: transcription repressor OFP3 [Tarenaya hassleriana]|uniref:transcription repressor OFP3 n=1 Tax=Tarenaya hassleriana TaxID=28532 RepID=UPI00053CA591|nr:PREDICTED: transcription repressor OFP3 [Tarenaya hassleriana]